MPTRFLRRSGLALTCAAAALALIPAAAAASKPVDLRVVDSSGETLAEHTQYTSRAKVKARPDADCFGEGTGGSGAKVAVPGATALGAVVDASAYDRDVRPVSVTDAFDFGLGVCGFGDAIAPSTGFWYLKINHVASQVGGDQARVRPNDDVLWYLIEDFAAPTPVELELDAPTRTTADTVGVRVWQYADNGDRTPAVGAGVTGAAEPTDAQGRTEVSLPVASPGSADPKLIGLRATREGAIPSNEAVVCAGSQLKSCPAAAGRVIRGSRHRDKIKGGRGNDDIVAGKGRDKIRAGAGDDLIDVKGGGRDIVRCGSGDDRVRASKRDVLKGCG